MAKFCGNCGTPLLPAAVFCGGCGSKVPAAAPSPASVPGPYAAVQPAPAAADYTPVQPAFAPAPPASTWDTPPVWPATRPAPELADWSSSVSAPAVPVVEPAGFAPVSSTFDITRDAPVAEPRAESAVPATSMPPVTTPPAAPAGYTPVMPAFPSAPARPAVELGGSTAANPAFAPLGTAPANAQSTYAAVASVPPAASAGYAPVQTGGGSAQPYTPFTPPASGSAVPGTAYPAKKSNTLLKVVVAFVLIIFVGGALAFAGLWYAAQKIKAKARSVANQVLAGNPPLPSSGLSGGLSGLLGGATPATSDSDSEDAGGFKGDPCRFLTKEEVGQATGLPVIRAEGSGGACNYIAKGDPADVTSKHLGALMGGMGADEKTQKIAQKISGAFFGQQEAGDKALSAQAATGEVNVLALSFSAGHAAMEMKLNRAGFQRMGVGSEGSTIAKNESGDLPGIGDEAFVVGGSAILLRKGNTMARMIYTGCPCGTKNVKPLAQKLASRL